MLAVDNELAYDPDLFADDLPQRINCPLIRFEGVTVMWCHLDDHALLLHRFAVGSVGVFSGSQELREVAEATAVRGGAQANPRTASPEQIEELFRAVW